MKIKRLLALTLLGTVAVALPARAEQKEVTVWSWFVQSTMQRAINAFEKAHPDIKVKYTYYNYSPEYVTALKAAAASDSLPDVIGLQPGSLTQQYRPQLEALNAHASKQWGDDWQSKMYSVNRKQMMMGNPAGDANIYLLPSESQDLVIWYNTKVFDKLGIAVPKSYDDLVAAAKALAKGGLLPMFQGAADGWQNENVFLMLASQRAPGLVDKAQNGEAKWTSPELVQAMEDWRGLFKDGVFQQGALGAHAYPTGAQLFSQGRVGMMALGSWWMQESMFPPPLSKYVQNMDGFDFFYMPALKGSDHPSPPVGGIDIGYGMTKNGGQNPAAWTFLASLADGEALQAALNDLNDLPAFVGHEPHGDVTPHVKAMYDRFMADLPKAENQRFAVPAIAEALDNALSGVAAESLEPVDALKSVQDATDKALAR